VDLRTAWFIPFWNYGPYHFWSHRWSSLIDSQLHFHDQ
jgi:hypothetical protein